MVVNIILKICKNQNILRHAAPLWLWGSLPRNSHNEAAYLKTKAVCLKIKKMRQPTSKLRQPASKSLNQKNVAIEILKQTTLLASHFEILYKS